MAAVNKQDSNKAGLRYAQETSYGVLPASPNAVWYALEPNSFNDFGGQITTVARNPINDGRQRKKGVTTDLDASGGFEMDLTYSNLQDLMQGFMFASLSTKTELNVTGTVNGTKTYTVASGGAAMLAGDLIFAKNFATVAAANGVKTVASSTATTVVVSESIGTANDTTGIISRVGFVFGSADANIDASGSLPQLKATTKNLTQLGLTPGEWIYIGGDAAGEKFATAANNGWARVKSITATAITLDKTAGTMVTDAGTGKTIKIFFGRVLKNQIGSNIVRRSYQLERTLGAPDDSLPSQIQSEYLVGAVPSEFELAVNTADKVTCSLSFVAKDNEQRTGATGVKSGTRPTLVDADAYNTSSDIKRIKLGVINSASSNVTPLFAFVTDLSISINNNLTPNKAVGVLGAFEVTAGTFEVTASMTAYFADVSAVAAVRNNSEVTLDLMLVKANQGISFDFPLIALGDGRLNVEQDQPITLPLSSDMATGAKIDSNMNHTMMICFYDYLPNAAN